MLRQLLCRCSSASPNISTSLASSSSSRSSLFLARQASTAAGPSYSRQAQSGGPRRIPFKPPSEQSSFEPSNQVKGPPSPLTRKALPSASLDSQQSLSKAEQMRQSKEMSAQRMSSQGIGSYGRARSGTALATQSSFEAGSIEELNRRFEASSSSFGSPNEVAASTASSRSMPVLDSGNFARQYRRLMGGVIAMNNVRTELRLQERYEKPKYKRQRLQSMRHRRRFAREIGLKVAAVMKAKSQGM